MPHSPDLPGLDIQGMPRSLPCAWREKVFELHSLFFAELEEEGTRREVENAPCEREGTPREEEVTWREREGTRPEGQGMRREVEGTRRERRGTEREEGFGFFEN